MAVSAINRSTSDELRRGEDNITKDYSHSPGQRAEEHLGAAAHDSCVSLKGGSSVQRQISRRRQRTASTGTAKGKDSAKLNVSGEPFVMSCDPRATVR